MLRYLVYNSNEPNKKYVIQTETKEDLESKIRKILNLRNNTNIFIEYFDQEFEEFCVITHIYPDGGKLKVTEK